MSISFILLICAFICFVLAAAGVSTGRVSTVPLGLALWVGASLVGTFVH